MSALDLVRDDLRAFAGYRSARSDRLDGDAWLNANESPFANIADARGTLRRYPDPQPDALRARLAALYGCRPDQLVVGRGSDEAIDLLVRAVCAPGQAAIVTTPPTFGMYAVGARLHGVRVVEVPLVDAAGSFRCDFDAVAQAVLDSGAKLVFLCSPGNPTGDALPIGAVGGLAQRLDGHALVVVDEAYQEFSASPSATTLLDDCGNVVVLRTLSKAHALAGARIGVAIADPDLVAVLRRCQAPYPLPAPCIEQALAALGPSEVLVTRANAGRIVAERERMARALAASPRVVHVYPSSANFLLVRLPDAQSAFVRLLDEGLVVRDVRAQPGLDDALRISVGTPDQNDRVLAVLAPMDVAA